ncbi:hypothetical protein HAX54_026463, partial [Datura stramonium]|nr:hypothetical protein [Datura stramonium]
MFKIKPKCAIYTLENFSRNNKQRGTECITEHSLRATGVSRTLTGSRHLNLERLASRSLASVPRRYRTPSLEIAKINSSEADCLHDGSVTRLHREALIFAALPCQLPLLVSKSIPALHQH